MMNGQEIRIKLRAYENALLDRSVAEIVATVRRTGAAIKGPIPFPRKIYRFSLNRSPHVDKKSQEQFEMRSYRRLIVIKPAPQTVSALMSLSLAAGVDVDIKVSEAK